MERTRWPSRTILPGSIRYSRSEGSLDHTSIEEFRNRFGTKGAELITKDMMRVAKEFGFTKGDDVGMDTTVQDAGITHPTEMKLMGHLMRRLKKLHGEIKKTGQRGISGIKRLLKSFGTISSEYRFFAKTKQIAIQPKGNGQSLLNKKDQKRLSDRRAGIEPRIAHLKTRGLGRNRMKTDLGDLISGYRSALSYNLSLLMKDLAANQMNLMPA